MWLQWILIAIFMVTMLMLMQKKENKGKKPADGSPNPVLVGTPQALRVTLSYIFGRSIPNYELLAKWVTTCGGLMIINVPTKRTAMINIADLTIAKQVMNSSSYVNRLPDEHYLYYSSHFNKPLGLLFGNGNWWKESRKLTMKLLHQMDFFQLENMEQFMTFEIIQVKSNMDEQLKKSNGESTIRVDQMFQLPTLNIVYQVIMGKRFEHDDPFIKELFPLMNHNNRNFNIGTSVLEIIPWLRRIPGLTLYGLSRQGVSSLIQTIFCSKLTKELGKIHATVLTNPSSCACATWFLPDLTQCVLEHGIFHVSLRPEIQKRAHAEIDVGHNRLPSYEDKNKMAYTQAVLLEIMRYATPIPLTSGCRLEETKINFGFIPKGSLCGINIHAIHRSPDVWDDPEVFRPERFLNDQTEIVNSDKTIPFGYGKRLCVGESVARATLFIFFVSLMQKYLFEISAKHPPPSFKNNFGLSRYPIPYYVNVRSRS